MSDAPLLKLDDGLTRSIDTILDELNLLEEILTLDNARILDLGCGDGAKTRAIAMNGKNRHVIGMDVDENQLAKNKSDNIRTPTPNVSFQLGGALDIPANNDSFDIVLLFKSLHHVQNYDKALNEIVRVIKPGGKVWISEPLYRGELNGILALFHDERIVRRAAFEAIVRSVNSGVLEPVSQTFFLQRWHFEDYADFERQIIQARCSHHDVLKQVRARYLEHANDDGSADFFLPMRVDLLQKPV